MPTTNTIPDFVGTLYLKMIDVDRVDLVIGPFGNAVLAPILPIVARAWKAPVLDLTTTANAQSHYDRYFNMGPWGDKPEGFQGLYALLAAKHGLKRIALLSVDIEGPQVMTQQVRTIAAREGLTVVYDQKYPANTTEFSSLLRSINSADPDVIYVASAPADSIAIINQLSEIGVSDSVQMCCGGMVGLQLSSVLGKLGPKVNGLVNYALYAPVKTMQYAGTQAFFDRYSERAKKAGIDPLGYYGASFAYAQGQVLQQAIEATKSLDDQALAKYMHFAEFDTIVGKISFTPDGEWTRSGVCPSPVSRRRPLRRSRSVPNARSSGRCRAETRWRQEIWFPSPRRETNRRRPPTTGPGLNLSGSQIASRHAHSARSP